jgi:predicted GIY-YIG superfamily endonuclease
MPKVSVGLDELPETPHFLYRLYDRTDALLYIGITNDPKARFKHHRRHKDWWPDVDQSKTRIDYFASRSAALDAEAKAIKTENPLYNDQHNLTVDTPTRMAAAEAVNAFADSMLARMLGDPDAVEAALQEAEADMAELRGDGEVIEDASAAAWAASNIAERMQSAITVYQRTVANLIAWLPEEVVQPAYEMACADLGIPFGEDDPDLADAAAQYIQDGMAGRLLAALPDDEEQRWRASAVAFLDTRRRRGTKPAPEMAIIRRAAGYARAARSENPYLLKTFRCIGADERQSQCLEVGSEIVVFNGCKRCAANNSGCVGHGGWCPRHFQEFLHAGSTRVTPRELPAAPERSILVNDKGQSA